MKSPKSLRTIGVAAVCVALGTAGGIASSGAATSKSKKANSTRQGPPAAVRRGARRP